MKASKLISAMVTLLVWSGYLLAGNLAREFNIFAPPQTDFAARKSFVVVTAVVGNGAVTELDIIDRAEDGDSDDTYENLELTQGQSYIVLISEGSVDDDYNGIMDGDYFKIQSNRRVQTMIGTISDWEFDYIPPYLHTDGTSDYFVFIPYGPDADEWRLNVISYKDGAEVFIEDITDSPTTGSGYTSVVSVNNGTEVWSGTLNEGEDLLTIQDENVLGDSPGGHTFHVHSSDSVAVMVGALRQAHSGRDGGTYVKNGAGINADTKFYFYMPDNLNDNGEKEIRINTYSQPATINLYSWDGSSWDLRVSNQTLQAYDHFDYIGENVGYDQELFKLEATAKIAVFTATYLETGNESEIGTLDMGTYVSSEFGYSPGHNYIVFLPPPGWGISDERISHVYITTIDSNTTVSIKDMDTDGGVINETITLNTNDVYDFQVDTAVYNQLNEGDNRPYLKIYAAKDIRIFDTNWNDNWLAFAGGITVPQYSPQVYENMPYRRWVFLAFPLNLDDNNPDSIFADYFGGPEGDPAQATNTNWRFSRWSVQYNTYVRWGEADYDGQEHGDPPLPIPGRGYWFYQNWGDGINLEIEGSEVDTDYPYYIPLDPPQGDHPGLNQVGNPFPFTIDWKNTQVKIEYSDGSYSVTSLLQANQLGLLDSWAYRWNGYEYVAYNSINGGDLTLWDGFWVEQLDTMVRCDSISWIRYKCSHENDHTCIRYHDPRNQLNQKDKLGENGALETDYFSMQIYNGNQTVTVELKDTDNNEAEFDLNPGESSEQLGFRVTFIEKVNYSGNYDLYSFTISSISNTHPLKQVKFCYGDDSWVWKPYHGNRTNVARTSSSRKARDIDISQLYLKIPPINIGQKKSQQASTPSHNPYTKLMDTPEEWIVPIGIKRADSLIIDTYNGFGVLDSALSVYDKFDARDFMPQSGQFANLYFPHDNFWDVDNYWPNRPIKACYDIQSAYFDTLTWYFQIMSWNLPDKEFTLFWDASQVPDDFELNLIELNTPDSVNYDMKSDSTVTLSTPSETYGVLSFQIIATRTLPENVQEGLPLATSFMLYQNYPNPFNTMTRIRYELDKQGYVELKIYSIDGKLVRSLIEERQEAGFHTVLWDGRNDSGLSVPSGVYFIQLKHGNRLKQNKAILLK